MGRCLSLGARSIPSTFPGTATAWWRISHALIPVLSAPAASPSFEGES